MHESPTITNNQRDEDISLQLAQALQEEEITSFYANHDNHENTKLNNVYIDSQMLAESLQQEEINLAIEEKSRIEHKNNKIL
eukprot:UN27468